MALFGGFLEHIERLEKGHEIDSLEGELKLSVSSHRVDSFTLKKSLLGSLTLGECSPPAMRNLGIKAPRYLAQKIVCAHQGPRRSLKITTLAFSATLAGGLASEEMRRGVRGAIGHAIPSLFCLGTEHLPARLGRKMKLRPICL